jgi:predicted ATP-grasp superfamily ATP-dependent carboligase
MIAHAHRVRSQGQTSLASADRVELRQAASTLRGRRPAADALVLDASLRQSLVTVRSLGRRGLAVDALETTRDALAFASRWCRRAWVCPTHEGSDDYADYVEQILARSGAMIVIPSSDGTIELLRRRRCEIEQWTRLAMASERALAIAVNKQRTLELAARLGLTIPRQTIVRSADEVGRAVRDIGLPAVIKPCMSWQGRGSFGRRLVCALVTTPDEARTVVTALTRFGVAALVQQFLSGRRDAISFLYANGRVYARFAQSATRTCPPLGGESVLRHSVPLRPELAEQAEALVRAIGLEGYSEVEFRDDAVEGTPHLMEVNPRLSASVELAVRSGVDFPQLVYQWASGRAIDTVRAYRTGVWMRYLGGDIMTTYASLRERGRPAVARPARALFEFGATFFRPMAYDGLDFSDLRPALRATKTFARTIRKSLFQLKRNQPWTAR